MVEPINPGSKRRRIFIIFEVQSQFVTNGNGQGSLPA